MTDLGKIDTYFKYQKKSILISIDEGVKGLISIPNSKLTDKMLIKIRQNGNYR